MPRPALNDIKLLFHHEILFCPQLTVSITPCIFTGQSNMPVIELETVSTADFLEVIAHTKPSARSLMERYSAWEKEYESVWHVISCMDYYYSNQQMFYRTIQKGVRIVSFGEQKLVTGTVPLKGHPPTPKRYI